MTVQYPQKTHDNFCHEKDPINLIFVNTNLNDILRHLEETGWKNPHVRFKQFLPDPSYRTCCLKVEDADKIFGHLLSRFHVRIWHWGDQLIGSAHYETGRFFKHEVHHFEGAEEKITDDFSSSNRWDIVKNKYDLHNRELIRYNNGLATEIKRK